MKALITGASSGLGYDMAVILSKMGYELFVVARREDKLNELKGKLDTKVNIICLDLSEKENCFALYEQVKNDNIDILINNAGFGIFGEFVSTDIENELKMIDININAVHILTKLFLKDFVRKNSGYIMNVASSAGFMPGPLMSSYYASKAYVLNLTTAIHEELRREKSKINICSLCPGPVDTEFNSVAKVSFGVKSLESKYVAEYAIKQMFKKKMIIVPSFKMKFSISGSKFVSRKFISKITYDVQKLKRK